MYGVKRVSGMGRYVRRGRFGLGDASICPSLEQQAGIFDMSDPCQNNSGPLDSLPMSSTPANSILTNPLSAATLNTAASTIGINPPFWVIGAVAGGLILFAMVTGGRR